MDKTEPLKTEKNNTSYPAATRPAKDFHKWERDKKIL
jgi:hypothetical protein